MHQNLHLNISGMTCGHCEKFVQSVLEELPGVQQVKVNQKTGQADLQFDPAVIREEAIRSAINVTVTYKVVQ